MGVKNLRIRSIVGVVGKVELACGCHALIALGQAAIRRSPESRHITVYECPDWKQHKYEVARVERDLADRLKQTMNHQRRVTKKLLEVK